MSQNRSIANTHTENIDQHILDLLKKISDTLIQIQHNQVTFNATKNLKLFDGAGDNISAEEWVNELERIEIFFDLSDETMYEIASRHLEKGALSWFYEIRDTVLTWADFMRVFEARFCSTSQALTPNRILAEKEQTRGESLNAYFYEKLRLCESYNLSFSETRLHLLYGLRSRSLRVTLLSRSHTDVEGLWYDLLHEDRLARQHRIPLANTATNRTEIYPCQRFRESGVPNCPECQNYTNNRSSTEDN